MAHGRNAEAVIRAAVHAQDPADQLTELQFTGGRLWVPRIELPAGAPVRLRVRARDVSLALQPVSGTSVLNNLPVVVAEVDDDGPAQVMVSLRAGDQILLTRVTRRSRRLLDIGPGKSMYAQIKSVALMA
jgi:molybdate transport system ATP-binding protein